MFLLLVVLFVGVFRWCLLVVLYHLFLVSTTNAETYVYNMRDAISSTLTEYVGDEEKESFLALLSAEENWLYTDEGYDGDKVCSTHCRSPLY